MTLKSESAWDAPWSDVFRQALYHLAQKCNFKPTYILLVYLESRGFIIDHKQRSSDVNAESATKLYHPNTNKHLETWRLLLSVMNQKRPNQISDIRALLVYIQSTISTIQGTVTMLVKDNTKLTHDVAKLQKSILKKQH